MAIRKTLIYILSLIVASYVALGVKYTDTGITIIGTTEPYNFTVMAGTSCEHFISYEFASYISVQFGDFNLPKGDFVTIRSPYEKITVSHTYTGRGRDKSGTFVAAFVPGDSVIVIYKSNKIEKSGQGFRITGFSRGYPKMQHESVCGDGDQSLPAKCYAPGTNLSQELPHAYKKARAVARLLVDGVFMCTGWLGGSEGHLFTNYHCFEQRESRHSIDIEFDAEGASCSDQCETQFGCPGKLMATTLTFVAGDEDIDYAILKLPDCVNLSAYGYLQFRESGPVAHESIYLPQHPDGHAKRIVSTIDGGESTTIHNVGENGKCGIDQIGHDADTREGSSGSPLIASSDNLVVGIHHCGGCMNAAIDVRTVLTDLAMKKITIKNLVPSKGVTQKSQLACANMSCVEKQKKSKQN